jgi:hypothetical protein
MTGALDGARGLGRQAGFQWVNRFRVGRRMRIWAA